MIDIDFLSDVMLNLKSYKDLLKAIGDNEREIATYGVTESALGHLSYSLSSHVDDNILLVTYDQLRAKKYYEDILSMGYENVYYFPKKELFFFNREAQSMDNTILRLNPMKALIDNEKSIIVTTFEALKDKVVNRENFESKILNISMGEEVDLDNLSKKLLEMGYEHVSHVEGQGQYSIRGGIVDIYSIDVNPYRIEFFDIEVDSIRSFDPLNQRSIENLKEITISPMRDILILNEEKSVIIDNLKSALSESKSLNSDSYERLEEKYRVYLDNLETDSYISNTDLLIPFIPSSSTSSLLDYLGNNPVIMSDEPGRIDENNETHVLHFKEKITDLMEYGEVLTAHENMIYDESHIKNSFREGNIVLLNSIIRAFKGFNPSVICNFKMRSATNYKGKMQLFKDDINNYLYRGYKIAILGGSVEKCKRLQNNLLEMGLNSRFAENSNIELHSNEIVIIPGSINQGFEYTDIRFVLINYSEIYGTSSSKRKKSGKRGKELNFSDLKVGDHVVHESHGIGQYMGTEQLEVQGVTKDYMNITYRGGDKLFLPIEQLNLIYKYIGEERPKINKLNSVEWSKTKTKAKKVVEEMAEDLIELYAKRASSIGYRFNPDTTWQGEFEDSFPFEETDGQLQSIAEIKEDMESARPMDRLLCADVGFGKTEVALRAAFKAIMDGKQVAFLVPTTILAQQHYNTIIERFAEFPVDVVLLSRFRSAKEQKEGIKKIRNGMADIVIGTHRILSKDVEFKDLGLLIIDEEQRFGVRHKEKLKLLKENVDTITLTATPIPRTLQMSMIGIRDMSIIEEPPEERFPVQTYVLEYNDILIRDAVIKEIDRGGQVYYVYNKVLNMENKLAELRKLVPEATFAMANGQMPERQLEDIMISFFNGKVDVLVCSTIIETGMDVSNANTMIITDANKLGLSQLYQLKGRIGRSNKIAYAYLTYERDTSISEVAEKRLKAIKEFTEFGSGYKIAMRDLEIRGSGSILGSRQSGQIETIGYDLYIKYLKEAVLKLKNPDYVKKVDTLIDIKVDAYIPSKYIEDEEQKLEIYKKISVLESKQDYEDLLDELIDRFGDMPEEVSNLMDLSQLRYEATNLNIKSITEKNKQCEVLFTDEFNMDLALINEITDRFKKSVKISMGNEKSVIFLDKKYLLTNLEDLIEILKIHKTHTQ